MFQTSRFRRANVFDPLPGGRSIPPPRQSFALCLAQRSRDTFLRLEMESHPLTRNGKAPCDERCATLLGDVTGTAAVRQQRRRFMHLRKTAYALSGRRFTFLRGSPRTRAPTPTYPKSLGGVPCINDGWQARAGTVTGYLQSRCFFLGPIISSVVALQTDLARPWPAMLCLAASSLSFIVCPAILSLLLSHWDFSVEQLLGPMTACYHSRRLVPGPDGGVEQRVTPRPHQLRGRRGTTTCRRFLRPGTPADGVHRWFSWLVAAPRESATVSIRPRAAMRSHACANGSAGRTTARRQKATETCQYGDADLLLPRRTDHS